jgi:hypothetical protein
VDAPLPFRLLSGPTAAQKEQPLRGFLVAFRSLALPLNCVLQVQF